MADITNINGINIKDAALREGIDTLRSSVVARVIKPLTVTEDGTYTADPTAGTYGYSPVVVDVADSAYWKLKVRTTEDGEIVNLGIRSSYTGADVGEVNWGDGSPIETCPNDGSHTYEIAGAYTITLLTVARADMALNMPKSQLVGVVIPKRVTAIRSTTFMTSSLLEEVVFPHTITDAGSEGFRNCTSLTSIELYDGVTQPGWSSFRGCTGLRVVVLPKTVTTMSNYAFSGCTHLISLTILAETPPTLGTSSIPDNANLCIYVPAESVDTYKEAWSAYASKIVAIGTRASAQSLSMGSNIMAQVDDTQSEEKSLADDTDTDEKR